jgi:hypothetical protein
MSLFPKFQNQEWKANDPATPATPATFTAKSSESSGSSNPPDLDLRDSGSKKPTLETGWSRLHWTDDSGSMRIDWEKGGIRIPVDSDDMAEFLARQNPKPVVRKKVKSKNPTMLNIIDPETKKTPQLDLLTEVELEAFNGWYATMRKPKFNLSHEEATHKAWQLLIESMESMYKRGGGRWLKKSD